MAATKPEKAPILAEKNPKVRYTKRYDQVSWRSADTDFEPEPSLQNGTIEVKSGKYTVCTLCTKRTRKLIALIIVVVIFIVIMAALIYLYYSKPIVVNLTAAIATDCGSVTGIVETVTLTDVDYDVNVFRGIPYALPPVGRLRWTPPVPLSADTAQCWKGIYKAHKYGSICAQKGNKGSEDCLFLNVYTPNVMADANLLPVIVWIHGGYLMQGSGNEPGYTPGIEYAITAHAVIVTFNYRLNLFGFLTLEELWQNGKGYANYGLMDQISVLKWVQNNIRNFGGNPDSVTICGHNAGGSSVLALLASPQTTGLFHNVISMSAFTKMDIPYNQAAIHNRPLLKKTKCNNITRGDEIRKCLYNMTTSDVLDVVPYFRNVCNGLMEESLLDFPIKGVISGGLIVIDPLVLPTSPLKMKDVSGNKKKKISVLIGSTAQEVGVSPIYTFDGDNQWPKFKNHITKYLDAFSANLTDLVLGKLYNNDSIQSNIAVDERTECIHETIISDVRVTCPTNTLFDWLDRLKHVRAYRYIVAHAPHEKISLFRNKSRFAFHMWDLITLFNFQIVNSSYVPDKSDMRFRSNLLGNFKHLVSYGHMMESDWSQGSTAVFDQDGGIMVLPTEYHKKQCAFWNDPLNGFVPYAWSD